MWTRREIVGVMTTGVLAPAVYARPGTTATPGAAPLTRSAESAAFRSFAETTHPRGCDAASDHAWRTHWDALAVDADRLSDGAYFQRVRRGLGWFRDGHTTVLPFEFVGGIPAQLSKGPFRLSLPVDVRVFHDGAWIAAAGDEASPLLGTRVEKVGRLSAAELIGALAVDWPGNNAWAHRWSAGVFVTPAFLQAMGAIDDPEMPVVLETTGRDARQRRIAVPARERETAELLPVDRRTTAREEWAKAAGGGNYVRVIEGVVGYLSLDDMDDVEGKTFEALTREVFAVLDRPDVRRLVIDLRRNGGGNNFHGEALRKRIGRSRLNHPGGLYVLIGPRTFSAAQNLANRLERETFAIFVGEPTGGAPNHYGDARIHAGAVTGITAIVSSLPWFDSYPQDQRPWIMPDLPVAETFVDWRDGHDRALTTAIEHTTDAVADDLSRDRTFYFRRDSQVRDWSPFWLTLPTAAALTPR